MSAQLLTDHSDFNKARRALFTASVVLIVVTQLDLQSDQIEIFKLKLGVEKSSIIAFNAVAVFYFSYVFALQAARRLPEIGLEAARLHFQTFKNPLQNLVQEYVLDEIRPRTKVILNTAFNKVIRAKQPIKILDSDDDDVYHDPDEAYFEELVHRAISAAVDEGTIDPTGLERKVIEMLSKTVADYWKTAILLEILPPILVAITSLSAAAWYWSVGF